MNDAQIKHMVDRFLGWKLPEPFRPDSGITFTPIMSYPEAVRQPSGTNLFDATQADAMVRYMVEGLGPKGDPTGIADGVAGEMLDLLASRSRGGDLTNDDMIALINVVRSHYEV